VARANRRIGNRKSLVGQIISNLATMLMEKALSLLKVVGVERCAMTGRDEEEAVGEGGCIKSPLNMNMRERSRRKRGLLD